MDKGQWLVVTGASSGIGRAFAVHAAKRGYALILHGRNEARLNETQQACVAVSGHDASRFQTFIGDLSNGEVIDGLVDFAFETAGDVRALIHCAGFGVFSPILESSEAMIMDTLRVNLAATIRLTQQFAHRMLKYPKRRHNITMIASVAAKIQTPNNSVYAASKAGVWGYANGLRQDLSDTLISVTCVFPGPVDTAFFEHSAANRRYRRVVAPFLSRPETIARRMYWAMHLDQAEVVVPWYFEGLAKVQALAPAAFYRNMAAFFRYTPFKK